MDSEIKKIPLGKFRTSSGSVLRRAKKYRAFYLMALPALICLALFHYWPMYGIRIAFYQFGLGGMKDFIGLENFRELLNSVTFQRAFGNTLLISSVSIALQLFMAIVISLLINEISYVRFKRTVQTVIYLPHFLSWVITASVFYLFLSPENGLVNSVIRLFGADPIHFVASTEWWRQTYWSILLWTYGVEEVHWTKKNGTPEFLPLLTDNTRLFKKSLIARELQLNDMPLMIEFDPRVMAAMANFVNTTQDAVPPNSELYAKTLGDLRNLKKEIILKVVSGQIASPEEGMALYKERAEKEMQLSAVLKEMNSLMN